MEGTSCLPHHSGGGVGPASAWGQGSAPISRWTRCGKSWRFAAITRGGCSPPRAPLPPSAAVPQTSAILPCWPTHPPPQTPLAQPREATKMAAASSRSLFISRHAAARPDLSAASDRAGSSLGYGTTLVAVAAPSGRRSMPRRREIVRGETHAAALIGTHPATPPSTLGARRTFNHCNTNPTLNRALGVSPTATDRQWPRTPHNRHHRPRHRYQHRPNRQEASRRHASAFYLLPA